MQLICSINVFYRYGKEKLDSMLKDFNIDMKGLITVLVINEVPGISQKRLNNFLFLDKGNLSKFLSFMEQKEMITRQYDKYSKERNCFLTEKSKLMIPDLLNIMKSWELECLKGCSEEEIENFYKVSTIITNNLYSK